MASLTRCRQDNLLEQRQERAHGSARSNRCAGLQALECPDWPTENNEEIAAREAMHASDFIFHEGNNPPLMNPDSWTVHNRIRERMENDY